MSDVWRYSGTDLIIDGDAHDVSSTNAALELIANDLLARGLVRPTPTSPAIVGTMEATYLAALQAATQLGIVLDGEWDHAPLVEPEPADPDLTY